MLQSRFDAADKQRVESVKRPRQQLNANDDDAPPLSGIEEKSRPPQQMRRAATAGAVVDSANHRVDQAENCAEVAAELTAASQTKTPAAQHPIPAANADKNDDEPLPPGWHQATAPDGNVYYYHATSGATQWLPPTVAASDLSA